MILALNNTTRQTPFRPLGAKNLPHISPLMAVSHMMYYVNFYKAQVVCLYTLSKTFVIWDNYKGILKIRPDYFDKLALFGYLQGKNMLKTEVISH